MGSEIFPTSTKRRTKCSDCGCSCAIMEEDGLLRSVKRKHLEFKANGLNLNQEFLVPRVEIEDECCALREMVTSQQQTIQNLVSELEEERNAASSAANEAMSMILKLQNDKSEIQMEARQFKRLAEEKMSHNQHEAYLLEDLLYQRDQAILSLTCEVQAYRHKMLSYGIDESEFEADGGHGMNRSVSMTEISETVFDLHPYEIYPSLRCISNESHLVPNVDDEIIDMEKYVLGETPHTHDEIKDSEYRIYHSENNLSYTSPEGELVVCQSSRRPKHLRRFSTDSMSSPFAMNKEVCSEFIRYSPKLGSNNINKMGFSNSEENCDYTSEIGDDRIYTVDSAFHVSSVVSPRESLRCLDPRDMEIQKLYARLHALEADRESMKQAIISIGTEKAQMMLLKEIAQNLCKEMAPVRRMPERKQPEGIVFSLKSIFKWLISGIIFWRKRPHRCRYMVELSANNLKGLLMLLECGPQQWRWILRANLLKNAASRIDLHDL